MNDLKRSKKKMYKKQMPAIDSYNCNYEEPIVEMEEERGCQNNNHKKLPNLQNFSAALILFYFRNRINNFKQFLKPCSRNLFIGFI